jgi:hypothetical protein
MASGAIRRAVSTPCGYARRSLGSFCVADTEKAPSVRVINELPMPESHQQTLAERHTRSLARQPVSVADLTGVERSDASVRKCRSVRPGTSAPRAEPTTTTRGQLERRSSATAKLARLSRRHEQPWRSRITAGSGQTRARAEVERPTHMHEPSRVEWPTRPYAGGAPSPGAPPRRKPKLGSFGSVSLHDLLAFRNLAFLAMLAGKIAAPVLKSGFGIV